MNTRVVVLAATLLAGCSSTGLPAASPSVMVSPSPQASRADGQWGPLAVLRLDPTGSDTAAAEGELSITGSCVVLDGMTLVWADSQTSWDADRNVIVFSDPTAGIDVDVAAGDQISIGGGQVGDPPSFPWVAPPDPSCPSAWFGVGFIASVNGQAVGD